MNAGEKRNSTSRNIIAETFLTAFDITVCDGRNQYSVGENLGYNGNRHEWEVKNNNNNGEISANNFLKRFAMNGFGELR